MKEEEIKQDYECAFAFCLIVAIVLLFPCVVLIIQKLWLKENQLISYFWVAITLCYMLTVNTLAELSLFFFAVKKDPLSAIEQNKRTIKKIDLLYIICASLTIIFGFIAFIASMNYTQKYNTPPSQTTFSNIGKFIVFCFGIVTAGSRLAKAIYELFFQFKLESDVKSLN